MSGKTEQFISGAKLGKIACAHYGLDFALVAEVSIVMRPQEPVEIIITMFVTPDLLAKLHAETNQE